MNDLQRHILGYGGYTSTLDLSIRPWNYFEFPPTPILRISIWVERVIVCLKNRRRIALAGNANSHSSSSASIAFDLRSKGTVETTSSTTPVPNIKCGPRKGSPRGLLTENL